MELWDAYDVEGNKLDHTLIRGEEIPDGMYHIVCDIIVRHQDGSWLLMQRDLRKTYGGWWEASAGGSALMGETPEQCAARELEQETGLRADHMEALGKVIHEKHHAICCEFLASYSGPKDTITLQEGQTIAWRWVNTETLLTMPKDELASRRILGFIPELAGY